jgi:hypothetical protein
LNKTKPASVNCAGERSSQAQNAAGERPVAFDRIEAFGQRHGSRDDISSSNFPHFDVNPNSGEPEGECQHPRIAHNRILVDEARPSHVLLPIIPGLTGITRHTSLIWKKASLMSRFNSLLRLN